MSESSWLCEGPPSTVILKENRRQKTESVEGVLLKNHVGVLGLNTPKLEDHCLFLFDKSFEVDTQTLVVSTVLIQSICQLRVTGGLKLTKFCGVTGHRAHQQNHQVRPKLGLEIDFLPP